MTKWIKKDESFTMSMVTFLYSHLNLKIAKGHAIGRIKASG
jgi:hypothetical protein